MVHPTASAGLAALGFSLVVAATSACHGLEEVWGACPDLPTCGKACTPVDCQFGPWNPWYEGGGCTQIKFRHRSIAVTNNECGEPCGGAKIQSAKSPKPACDNVVQDCVLGAWLAWTACSSGQLQSFRSREVEAEPRDGGQPCHGSLRQTRVCEGTAPLATDCVLSEWHAWTTCSAKCGQGYHERMRRVVADASNGGNRCLGPLQEFESCTAAPCLNQDCVLGEWEAWSECDVGQPQRFRSRALIHERVGEGKACSGGLKETVPCPVLEVPWCVLGDWSAWTECDKTCDHGQQFRAREVVSSAGDGGHCAWAATDASEPMRDTRECNAFACGEAVDCQLAEWSAWSNCSTLCGQGIVARSRKVRVPAANGGSGCDGAMQEINDCMGTTCNNVDCLWSSWYDWSACSATCGSGTKRRSRVVTQAPRNHGKLCDAEFKSEVAECSVANCDSTCVDAEWGNWSAWTPCSATCGEGFQERDRSTAREANNCGRPVAGFSKEYRHCELPACIPRSDCVLAEWNDWSPCSCSCTGVRERNRLVKAFAAGGGQACDDPLRQVESCNPISGSPAPNGCDRDDTQDCILSEWSDWTQCSRSCGGGQTERSRAIEVFPKTSRAHMCNNSLTVTAGCNTEACDAVTCIDCEYSDWGEWGDCSHCGGQRFRSRHVDRLPNKCGKQCDLASTREVSNCTSFCIQELHCSWSDWSGASGCQTGCGGQSVRTRTLGFQQSDLAAAPSLFEAPSSALCTGSQVDTATCDSPGCLVPCVPQLCLWGAWSDWSGGDCLGICVRSRSIAQHGHECGNGQGALCQGALQETKACPAPCDKPVDCELASWSAWSECEFQPGVVHIAEKTGHSCLGLARDANEGELGVHPCKATGGQEFVLPEASSGPIRVRSDLTKCLYAGEVREGGRLKVGSKCDFEWELPKAGDKSSVKVKAKPHLCLKLCGATFKAKLEPCKSADTLNIFAADAHWEKTGQKMRMRGIAVNARNGGKQCGGFLEETQPCPKRQKIDCQLSAWNLWNDCSVTCAGGVQSRSRMIAQQASDGGEACDGSLEELQSCNTMACGIPVVNCEYDQWSVWSPCTKNQQSRERHIVKLAQGGGKPCEDTLTELKSCGMDPIPCEVSDWTAWDVCDRTCGTGQQARHRQIHVFPKFGGAPCPKDLHEVQGCATGPCPGAQDCFLGEWQPFLPCSASCGPGQQTRQRSIIGIRSPGGVGCEDSLTETMACPNNPPCSSQDCVWQDWSEWSDCSCKCGGGSRSRNRAILAMPSPGRQACEPHPLEELEPCNTEPCDEVLSKDGEWGLWSDWSLCSASCRSGVSFRTRQVAKMAVGDGTPVSGLSREQRFCSQDVPCEVAIDCVFTDWNEWGGCTSECNGVMGRNRQIKSLGSGSGKYCVGALKETFPCNPGLQEKPPPACGPIGLPAPCEFGVWSPWSTCSVPCGGGQTRRTRLLGSEAMDGGRLCHGPLEEVAECAREPCGKPGVIDCLLGDWTAWGPCDKCGGQMRRFRHVLRHPENGGAECPEAAMEETTACDINCGGKSGVCTWLPWADWEACMVTCGFGKRKRQRSLGLSNAPDAQPLPDEITYPEVVNIASKVDPTMCVSASEGILANGGNIHLWKCSDRKPNGRAFDFELPKDGVGMIRMAADPNYCLSDASAGLTHNGNEIQVWKCSERETSKAQHRAFDWEVAKGHDGARRIRMKDRPDKCISISGGHLHDGSNVQLWSCSELGEEKSAFGFIFKHPEAEGPAPAPAPGAPPPPASPVPAPPANESGLGSQLSAEYEELRLRLAAASSGRRELLVAFAGGGAVAWAVVVALRVMVSGRARPATTSVDRELRLVAGDEEVNLEMPLVD